MQLQSERPRIKPVVLFHSTFTGKQAHELFVMAENVYNHELTVNMSKRKKSPDDDELKMRVASSGFNNAAKSLCQRHDIVMIKIRRGFIQSQYTTAGAK